MKIVKVVNIQIINSIQKICWLHYDYKEALG